MRAAASRAQSAILDSCSAAHQLAGRAARQTLVTQTQLAHGARSRSPGESAQLGRELVTQSAREASIRRNCGASRNWPGQNFMSPLALQQSVTTAGADRRTQA